MRSYRIGIVGLGKITEDQHLPVIARSSRFELAAVASRRGLTAPGARAFRSHAEMLAAMPDLDAVAVCTPPSVRHAIAREVLAAGRHVLLEKPPTATVSELADLGREAGRTGRVLMTTWHSQHNLAVEAARDALRGRTVRSLLVNWKEDVKRWHPGQAWIWKAGGFGVFDPGINAFSILTRIMPEPLFVRDASLTFPSNCDAPIAAEILFRTAAGADGLRAELDWRQTGPQTWEIEIGTADGASLKLSAGGARLEVDGRVVADARPAEYESIYERFAALLDEGRSEVDEAPLRLVADAFMIGRRLVTEPFSED